MALSLFLHLAMSFAFAGEKPLDALVKTFYDMLATDKAKGLEEMVRAPIANHDRYGELASVVDKAKRCPTKVEVREYVRRLGDYYRRHSDATAAVGLKGTPAVSDRLLHLMLEDFSDVLAEAVDEVTRPNGKLSIGTSAALKRYAIAIERFVDKRLELYTERDEGKGGRMFDPEADDFLVDNMHFILSLLGAPIAVGDAKAFTNRDARGVRYFREALHVMQRELELGISQPVKVSVPRYPAWTLPQ